MASKNNESWARFSKADSTLWIANVDPMRWADTGELLEAPGPLDWGTASPDAIQCAKGAADRIISVESVLDEPDYIEVEVSFWNTTRTQLEAGAHFLIGGVE